MPYDLDNPPDRIKGLPKHAQEIWIKAYNSAIEQYEGDEAKANGTAWAAVKNAGYTKDAKGNWVKHEDENDREWRFNPDRVEVFRAGKYPQGQFSKGDLDEMINNFNIRQYEPPVTKDHAQDGPAFGWVKRIWREGNRLFAHLYGITKDFLQELKEGKYRRISVEIWRNYEDSGKQVLKAVSFLGAGAPQVKGMLSPVKYSSVHGLVDLIELDLNQEFKATEEQKAAQKARAQRYGISVIEAGHVTKPGEWSGVPDEQWADPVNYAYPCPTADQTRAALKYWGMPRNKGRYSSKDQGIINGRLKTFAKKFKIESELAKHEEVDMTAEEVTQMMEDKIGEVKTQFQEEIKTLTDENQKLKDQIAEKQKSFSEKERKDHEEKIASQLDRLVEQGKVIPAWRDAGLDKVLMSLDPKEVIEFSEDQKIDIGSWLLKFFAETMPQVINLGEVVTNREETMSTPALLFKVADHNQKLPVKNREICDKAMQFVAEQNKQGNKVSFKEALLEMSAKEQK